MSGNLRPRRSLAAPPIQIVETIRKTPAEITRERLKAERARLDAEAHATAAREAAIAAEQAEAKRLLVEKREQEAADLRRAREDADRIVVGGTVGGGKRTWVAEQLAEVTKRREALGKRLATEAGITNDADALRALRAEQYESPEAKLRREFMAAEKVEVFAQTEQLVGINGVEYRIPAGRSMVPKPFADLYRQSLKERAAPTPIEFVRWRSW